MRGNSEVILALRAQVKSEVTAMAQYRVAAQALLNAGYDQLAKALAKYFEEENHHSTELLDRLFVLGGQPDGADLVATAPLVTADVTAIFGKVLELELAAIGQYNRAAAQAASVGDNATADLFKHILGEEEDHAAWFETQLALIRDLGKANYLAEQMGE